MTHEYILEIEHVTKDFPGVRALDDISFSVRRGAIHGICGENGAGKSTLMKILAGVHAADTYDGDVKLNGDVIKFTRDAIHQAIEHGIAIVHQELALIPKLTVGENIYLGREPLKNGVIDWNKLYSDTQRILQELRLDISFDSVIDDLSVGKQQMVEIAKALSENAQVLILDEPTSALTESEVDKLMDILNDLRDRGVTCLYITHKMEEFFRITDDITVFRDGQVVGTVATPAVNHEKLVAMMVGREMKERFPAGHRKAGNVVLDVKNLSVDDPEHAGRKAIDNVSFTVRAGEILGVAGLMGSGRSELVTAIFGEYGKNHTGTIVLDGEPIRNTSARKAMENKISLVPEDRKRMGLVLDQSILKNISLANLDQFSGFLSINKHKEVEQCRQIAKHLSVKTPSLHAKVNSLSGGNQQKVVIAKWLLSNPRVLILDEPTRGIDVGAKYEIYKLMNSLAEQGVAIIMISSELPEILGMSDRVLVMHEGQCTGVLDRSDATQESIMALATGLLAEHDEQALAAA